MPTSDGFETPPASVTWSTAPDGALCARLAGEVDALNRDEVVGDVRARLAAVDGGAVHVDLAELAFCDARTLVVLAGLVDHARSRGVAASLTSVPPHLARILALVTGGAEPPGTTAC
ncbi:MAG: STAS domain-containing protein [Acidimicrobiales bacterium]